MVDEWLFSMEPLKKNRDNTLYLHSFYFWPIDIDKASGPHALKEASSKRLQAPGRAFGYIFDPDGKCLAFGLSRHTLSETVNFPHCWLGSLGPHFSPGSGGIPIVLLQSMYWC